MHPPYTALHSLLSQLHPHRQRIDEQPHHSFPPLLPLHPPQQHRPEYHILTSRHPPQHLPPRQMTQARRAHPYSPRTLPHPPPQLLLHCTPPLPDPSPISLHILHPIRQRRLLHIPQQFPEICLLLLLSPPSPRLRHHIPKLLRLR